MSKSPLNRRELIKKSIAGTALIAGASLVACSKKEEAPVEADEAADAATGNEETAKEYVSTDDQMAQSLSYSENADSVDSALRVDKGETPGAEQYCKNCQFAVEEEGNTEGVGCQLFPGKLVKSEGWCKSWSLKA